MDLTSLLGGLGGGGAGNTGGGTTGGDGSSGKGSNTSKAVSGNNSYVTGISTGQLALIITLGGVGLAMIGIVVAIIVKK